MITFKTDRDVLLHIDIDNTDKQWPNFKIEIDGSYIKYSTNGKFMEQRDLEILLSELDNLLRGKLKRTVFLSGMEPDLYFKLYPLVADDPYLEISICFWTADGGMGGNTFTMSLCGDEVKEFRDYIFNVLNN